MSNLEKVYIATSICSEFHSNCSACGSSLAAAVVSRARSSQLVAGSEPTILGASPSS